MVDNSTLRGVSVQPSTIHTIRMDGICSFADIFWSHVAPKAYGSKPDPKSHSYSPNDSQVSPFHATEAFIYAHSTRQYTSLPVRTTCGKREDKARQDETRRDNYPIPGTANRYLVPGRQDEGRARLLTLGFSIRLPAPVLMATSLSGPGSGAHVLG